MLMNFTLSAVIKRRFKFVTMTYTLAELSQNQGR